MRVFTVYLETFIDCLSKKKSLIQYLYTNCGISAEKHQIFSLKTVLFKTGGGGKGIRKQEREH